MTVRSARLALGSFSAVPDTDVVLYTVPAGKQTIVRSAVFYNPTASATVLEVRWRNSDTPANVALRQETVAGKGRLVDEVWRVLEAGDEIRCRFVGAAGQINAHISGAELAL